MSSSPAVRTRIAGLAVLALAGTLPLALTVGSAAAGTASAPAQAARPDQAPRPNIVYIMADDLGWSDLHTGRVNGGHGHDFHDTPALDRLADQGMTFDNAYASLNCAPTRMALMTGLYPTRPENNVYLVEGLNRGGDDTLLVGPAQGREDGADVLEPRTRTVAETLQGAGYDTGYVGKFHITRTGADVVAEHGFDENLGGSSSGFAKNYHARNGQFDDSVGPELDRFAGSYTQQYVDENVKPYSTGVSDAQLDGLVGTDKHVSDALADATIDYIDRNDDEPFLTWMSTYAVHEPTGNAQARRDLLAKYQARTPGTSASKPSYAALTEGLDQSVARVVEHLESTPDPRNPGHALADNTIVVFTSDNGGRTDSGADNGPLRGQKGELFEGGVRVPWIAWSKNPELVQGRTVNHAVINSTDLYPTLTDYAGARLPKGVPFDGTSLRETFADATPVDRPRYAHVPGYLISGGRDLHPSSYVRDGRWKLSYDYEDQGVRLYDLHSDIGESTNLAAARPDLVSDLGAELVRWLDRTDAPLAVLREGRGPLTIQVPRGLTYVDGRARFHARPTTLTVQDGEEVPLVVATSSRAG